MNGMLFLPSLGRPARLAETLASIEACGTTERGMVVVGQNDSLPERLPHGWEACRRPWPMTSVEVSNWIFRTWPGLDWYGGINDDHIVRTEGWDTALAAACHPWAIVSTNDLHQAPKRWQGAVAIGGNLARACEFLSPPFLHHCCVDDFWEAIGRRFGNWSVLMDVIVEHRHPFHGTAVVDDTYRGSYVAMAADRDAFGHWLASPEFATLIDRLGDLGLAAPSYSSSAPSPAVPFGDCRLSEPEECTA